MGAIFLWTQDQDENTNFLNDIDFSIEDVEKVLLALPNNSAAGPDGDPSELLKNLKKGGGEESNT